MQLYLVRADMRELAHKTISTIVKKERAGECIIILMQWYQLWCI